MSTFIDQLAVSDPGDEIIYHVGFHCVTRNGRRNAAAADAWKAYERGDVLLYQRRMGFEQLAMSAAMFCSISAAWVLSNSLIVRR